MVHKLRPCDHPYSLTLYIIDKRFKLQTKLESLVKYASGPRLSIRTTLGASKYNIHALTSCFWFAFKTPDPIKALIRNLCSLRIYTNTFWALNTQLQSWRIGIFQDAPNVSINPSALCYTRLFLDIFILKLINIF